MTAETYDVVPADRMRRAVARRMRQAVTEQPHVTLHARADARQLLAAKKQLAGRDGARITLTVVLMHLVARVLKKYPRLNGLTEDGEIRLYHAVNLGCAVALDDGLVVPVIRDADQKTINTLTTELADKTDRARAGALGVDDISGGTFTVSNLGAHGVEYFTPIINPPQLAILGVGAIREQLHCEDGVLRSVPYLHLSLSFDHAAVDGAQAAHLLSLVREAIEHCEVS